MATTDMLEELFENVAHHVPPPEPPVGPKGGRPQLGHRAGASARRSDTPTRVGDTGKQSSEGACSACKGAARPTEAPLGPESSQRIPRQIGRR